MPARTFLVLVFMAHAHMCGFRSTKEETKLVDDVKAAKEGPDFATRLLSKAQDLTRKAAATSKIYFKARPLSETIFDACASLPPSEPDLGLHEAAKANDVAGVLQRLSVAENVLDKRDEKGWTPLHHACASGALESAMYLCLLGADVRALTPRKSSALHCAAFSGNGDIVRLLRAYYADTDVLNETGRSAAQVAEQTSNQQAVDAFGESLHVAVSTLLQHGEDLLSASQKKLEEKGQQMTTGSLLPRAMISHLRGVAEREARLARFGNSACANNVCVRFHSR